MHWLSIRGLLAVSTVGVVAVVWAGPVNEARACSCGYSNELVAPLSDMHPSNAGVLLHATCGGLTIDLYRATVDEMPAQLVPDDNAWMSSFGLAKIEPAPQVGQEVVVERCADAFVEECSDAPQWDEVARFIATEADTTAPGEGGSTSLSHRDNELFPDCISADLQFAATVTDLAPQDEPVLFRGILSNPDGTVVSTDTRFAQEPADEATLFFDASSDALTVPPEELCVDVAAIDLAGNVSTIAQSCGSVGEPGTTTGDSSTGADSTSGGPTTGPATTGGTADSGETDDTPGQDDGVADRGCACTTDERNAPPWMLLAPLTLLARRRR